MNSALHRVVLPAMPAKPSVSMKTGGSHVRSGGGRVRGSQPFLCPPPRGSSP
jgi:hypothetical protein